MDRSLDDTIAERQHTKDRSRRPPPRRQEYPRDGVTKSTRDSRTNLENDWVHDKYDGDDRNAKIDSSRSRGRNRDVARRDDYDDRRIPEQEDVSSGAKLRVENLHYDITEDDLHDLFERIAPVESVKLMYDRAGRSDGTAFVIYPRLADAKTAIRDFDGANAKGQPIRLELMATSASNGAQSGPRTRRDNPFDRVENPRSLFDRVEPPKSRDRRARSASPGEHRSRGARREAGNGGRARGATSRERPSNVSRQAPDGIDRYVPGQDSKGGSSSGRRGPGGGREAGRRPGERRERASARTDPDAPRLFNGRPRKTQEELDAEMEDYWGGAAGGGGGAVAADASGAGPGTAATWANGTQQSNNNPGQNSVGGLDDDIDMIE